MRLDDLLVKRGYFSTRQKAKIAIKNKLVFVNGALADRPSMDVELSADITVIGEEKPKGYWKLKRLNEKWNFIKRGDRVLDLGSSAGGFISYASSFADLVVGIEYSREFEEDLKRVEQKNVRIIFADVFEVDISSFDFKFDVILDDLTLKPSDSYKALKRFIPVLKDKGLALFVAKTGIDKMVPEFDLEIVKHESSETLKEEYFLLRKC
ncbi:hypothetical protein Asulf_01091 [Archaeoglobus sulfaticallidus PM70-1]|uniref:RNA-binding S4 domain-containing protein n=1 Tax=Archaeoglobus sulfaticallidus PM70-1 TaxID=387631 RepID=N0BFP6_9EURY|nr:SAM-dependent methyltransferase [Archaeoglobus sulfaticallidus]AGK61092.1 hypothetical protein Asulf_01091 [Archaeoglobus sulfaticallidus PM70-1]